MLVPIWADTTDMSRDRRRSERLALQARWDVRILVLDCEPLDLDLPVLETDELSFPASLVDISRGGAGLLVGLPKQPGVYVGGRIHVGIRPSPELDRRWLWGEMVNMRLDGDRAVLLGVRWIPCLTNTETVMVLGRFIDNVITKTATTGRPH